MVVVVVVVVMEDRIVVAKKSESFRGVDEMGCWMSEGVKTAREAADGDVRLRRRGGQPDSIRRALSVSDRLLVRLWFPGLLACGLRFVVLGAWCCLVLSSPCHHHAGLSWYSLLSWPWCLGRGLALTG